MRVVVDANVFVSAAISAGPSHRVVQAWLEREAFELIVCPLLLDEVEEVLTRRPRLRRWIDLDVAMRFVETVRLVANPVGDPGPSAALTRDVNDDYLIVLARGHGVDYIVTGDKDLLEWPEQDPATVTPQAFEQMLAS